MLSDVTIIRAIVTYPRHANYKTPRRLFARAIHRGIINDNVVIIPKRREREKEEGKHTSWPDDRSIARSTAGGSRENSRTRVSSRVLPERSSLALFYLRISIKCRSIDDNHERRTKAALGLEGENVSKTRSGVKRGEAGGRAERRSGRRVKEKITEGRGLRNERVAECR